ncbi:MAG: hypothetical protein GPI94_09775 [Microcystis aeruginosa LG13-03]|nr:hypothetical protein [Microcystis aeruginosa LG13-13]NCR04225.1 hypothetical protein [Microcystis aeruginosa LG13-03]NCR62450.1 hypothetical protein [Microcystis aeruginosa LG11-05]
MPSYRTITSNEEPSSRREFVAIDDNLSRQGEAQTNRIIDQLSSWL